MLGLRGRMAAMALSTTAAALAAVVLLVGPALTRRAVDHTRETLLAEARLTARVIAPHLAAGAPAAQVDAVVDQAAREVGARITVVAPDGTVVADSTASGPALAALENHGARPEIQEALRAGVGYSIRRSTTVNEDLLYAAVALREQGRLLGVVRLARSMPGIAGQAAELRRAVLVALLLAFGLTALLVPLLASSMAGPLRDIMDSARRFAAGDLSARSRVARRDEVGELARILNVSADALQQRLTEIARDRGRTEAILAAMEDGVLALDSRGMVLLANERIRQRLGAEEPAGRHYMEVVRHPELERAVEAVLRTGQRVEAEVELPGAAWAVSATPFPGEEGRAGAVLTFHDVTERRRLERVRRDFVANASHELRTPLTSIRGFVEALEDGAVDEAATARRFLGKIRTHAERMGALVSDLLELSRLESGDRPPQWERVMPAEVAEDAVASLEEMARSRSIATAVRDEASPAVDTDADRLRHILDNLLENAIKYTQEGGKVEVVCRPAPDGGALVEVSDDGPGIPAEHQSRIFERFYRVDKARSRDLGGTGLGLAIVKHLAESIGGTVTVRSTGGSGATFTVALPRKK
jgi:two-component system, OmpR family, phosphate regulon sensor histidine kinase PhoR